MYGGDSRCTELNSSLAFHQICENYGPNLDTCPEGTVLGLLVDSSSCLHFYVNGMDQGVVAQDIPSLCYVLIDLYGQCEQVRREGCFEAGGNSMWNVYITNW